jgi:hypothetical protein
MTCSIVKHTIMEKNNIMSRSIIALAAVAVLLAGTTLPAQTAQTAPLGPAAAAARPSGPSVPISKTSPGQGTFTGKLQIVSFAVQNGQIVAKGIVTGSLVDEAGNISGIVRTVTLPLNRPARAATATAPSTAAAPTAGAVSTTAAIAPAAVCDVLHLDLGPLDLDLLGLVIHLDRVVLDIDAVSAAGNLVGNLLCAITHLLDGTGPLAPIVTLLNQLLALLG